MAGSSWRLRGGLLSGLLVAVAAMRAIDSDLAFLEDSSAGSSSPSAGAAGERGQCADAWNEYVHRLEHTTYEIKVFLQKQAKAGLQFLVMNMGGGQKFVSGSPWNKRKIDEARIPTVDKTTYTAMRGVLASGDFKKVAEEWKAWEEQQNVAKEAGKYILELVIAEWGGTVSWKDAFLRWDIYNDFTPGIAPYINALYKNLPDPLEYEEWNDFKEANHEVLGKAVTSMFDDLRNFCLTEKQAPEEEEAEEEEEEEEEPETTTKKPNVLPIVEPKPTKPEPIVEPKPTKPEPIVEPKPEPMKPTKPNWTVVGPDGSICPKGCNNCLKAEGVAKKGKVWCFTKKMRKAKPFSGCNALLYSGRFKVEGNKYGYRYLCKP